MFENSFGESLISIYEDYQIPNSGDPCKTKLYKIHGDILKDDSIIITSRDYRRFYSEKQNQLLWSLIKSLTAQYAVLFIGYSLNDENVQYMFYDIIEKVDKSHHNGLFLVSLGIPKYQVESFNNDYGLNYIDMNIYDFLEIIERNVLQNIITDASNDKIPISDVKSTLKAEKDWDLYTTEDENGKQYLIKHKNPIPVNFQLKPDTPIEFIQKLRKFIEGASLTPITISDKEFDNFSSLDVDGVSLFDITDDKGNKELTITPQGYHGYAQLFLSKSGKNLNHLTFEHYYNSRNFLLRISNQSFEFSLFPDTLENQINFNLKFKPVSDVFEGRQLFSFFKDWIDGDIIQISTEHWDNIISLPSVSEIKNTPSYKFILEKEPIYSTLFKIQNITNKKIFVPEIIPEEDINTIRELISIVFEEIQNQKGRITGHIELNPEVALNSKMQGFKLTGSKIHRFKLFNNDYCIVIDYTIAGIEVDLVNYAEIEDKRLNGITDLEMIVESPKFGFNVIQKISNDQTMCNNN